MSSYLSQFNYQFLRSSGQADEADIRRGDLRRFVFLHGLMGYGLNWRRIAVSLESQDISLIFDQRGHGKSWQPLTGYRPEDFADDLALITEEIGWDRFYLVGHSMGGRNALSFASRYPEKVEKLVIVDIGPESSTHAVEYYQALLETVPTPFSSKREAKEFFMNDFPQTSIGLNNPLTLGPYLYSNIAEKPDGTADWRFSKEVILAIVRQGRARDQWEDFKSLKMPTLVMRGEHSKELSEEIYQQMLKGNPFARGVVISNAGHWIHSDQPEAFVRSLLQFVNS